MWSRRVQWAIDWDETHRDQPSALCNVFADIINRKKWAARCEWIKVPAAELYAIFHRSSLLRSPTDQLNARVNFPMFGLLISDKWLWMMNEYHQRFGLTDRFYSLPFVNEWTKSFDNYPKNWWWCNSTLKIIFNLLSFIFFSSRIFFFRTNFE